MSGITPQPGTGLDKEKLEHRREQNNHPEIDRQTLPRTESDLGTGLNDVRSFSGGDHVDLQAYLIEMFYRGGSCQLRRQSRDWLLALPQTPPASLGSGRVHGAGPESGGGHQLHGPPVASVPKA
jgi:hypothetical protein